MKYKQRGKKNYFTKTNDYQICKCPECGDKARLYNPEGNYPFTASDIDKLTCSCGYELKFKSMICVEDDD